MRLPDKAQFTYSVSCAVLTAIIITINLNYHFVLDFDSWAYWEGSLSILNGEGYVNIRGTRITAWPPGFSMLLAFWQSVFGVTIFAVKMLFVSIGFCTALLLGLIIKKLFAKKWLLILLFIVVVGFTCSVFYKFHSESLWVFLSACLLFILVFHARIPFNTSLLLVFTSMLLCKNVSLALVPGLLVFIYYKHGCRFSRGLLLSLLSVIVPVLIWQTVRMVLDQTGSHFAGLPSMEKIIYILITNYNSFSQSLFVSKFKLGVLGTLLILLLMIRIVFTARHDPAEQLELPLSIYILFVLLYFFSLSAILSMTGVPAGQIRFYIPVFMIVIVCLARGYIVDSKFSMVYILTLLLISSTLAFRTIYFTAASLTNTDNWNTIPNNFQLSEAWVDGVLEEIDQKLESGLTVEQAMAGSWISYNTYLKWKGKPLISNTKDHDK